MKRLFTPTLILLIFFNAAYSQVTPLWTNAQTGTGDNSDRYNAIVMNTTGDLYLGGYSFNDGHDKDYLLVKMNSSGDTLWTRQYNGADNGTDKILFMGIDGSGNIYVTGTTDGGGINQNDILTQKYDDSGTLLWTQIYNNTNANQDDDPLGMSVDNSGNIFITGSTDADSTVNQNDDMLTLCYSSSGTLLWSAQVNGLGNGTDRGSCVISDNAGGCAVTGRTFSGNDDDVITIKYSSTGTETWRKVYDRGFGNDRGESTTTDGSGNIYVAGRAQNANDYDAMTIKYNSSGVAQWTKFYNNVDNDYGKKVFVDASGNVYVAGQTDVNSSGGNTDYDYVTIKYNSSGAQQWAKTFGNAAQNDEDPGALFADGSGNVYVTGKSDVNALAAVTADNYLTVKYNSSGTLQWSVYLDGSATNSDDIAEGFVYDGSTYLYVVGGSENTTTQEDGTVVKYAVSNGAASWTKSYNGKGDFSDKVQAIISDAKKNVYVTGYVFNYKQRKDLFLAKLNSSGATTWFRTYDFSQQDDEGKAITLDTSGNIYVAGNSIGNGTSDDYVTLKFDSSGNLLWTARYDFTGEADVATGIAVNPSNGLVFVTGYSDQNVSSKITNYDIATVKYSSTGSQLTAARYNGSGNGIDRAVDIAINPSVLSGGLYTIVTGKTWNGSNYDIVTLKYNNGLVQQWATIYAGTAGKDDEARDLVFDKAAGEIYITGNTGGATDKDNIIALKYNSSGVQQWASTFNGSGNYNDVGYGIMQNAIGVYVTGRTAASASGDTANLITLKYDKATGSQIWSTIYNGTGNGLDRGNALGTDQFGNVYACGESAGTSSGADFITIGYDASGRIRWTGRYNGAGGLDDVARVAVVDASGYVYAAGFAAGSSINSADGVTIKYCPPPPMNAGADVTICKGSSVTLNASGSTSYSWSPAAGLNNTSISNPIANPTATTSYIVTGDNGLGCTGKDTVKVTVNSVPQATITADGPLQFCLGDSVIFTANSCACTYQWVKGSTNIAGATNLSYTAKTAGNYKVVVTNTKNCSKSSTAKKVQIVCKSDESLSANSEFTIAVSPNPTASEFNLEWSGTNEKVSVVVLDLVGARVFQSESADNNQLKFGKDLPDGVYLIKVSRGSDVRMMKVIKSK
ncbi:MAG: SBBP repeat-containing protein [Chitinophagales bacterium]|nr:SBBP repeat-containing protein [Chitinophagales bacterium]